MARNSKMANWSQLVTSNPAMLRKLPLVKVKPVAKKQVKSNISLANLTPK